MKPQAPAAASLAAWAALALAGSALAADRQEISRHFTPRDQQVGRYQYVPFTVVPGTTRLVISYRYDRKDGANVVDLGVFEPGSTALGSPAYRGWSGGERETVTIALDHATPGYWPGPLPAGDWHVMLGLYKVGVEGVDVAITVDAASDPVTAPPPSIVPRPTTSLRADAAWYVGALHAHTDHSDGKLSPQQLADKARQEHLDFLAITDHNNTVHQLMPIEAPGLLLIVGEEVTTPGGHFNVWGLGGPRDYVDFRMLPGEPAVQTVMAAARARGALVSVNHPAGACFACSWTQAIPGDVHAIEISDERADSRLQALAIWDALLRQGRRVTAVATSDWHRGDAPLGTPSVRVWAQDLSTAAILAGIREGRVIVVAEASLPAPGVTVRTRDRTATIGDRITIPRDEPFRVDVQAPPAYLDARVDLVWNGEPVASGAVPRDGIVSFERSAAASGYLRVHLTRSTGAPLVVTNPVFIDVAAP